MIADNVPHHCCLVCFCHIAICTSYTMLYPHLSGFMATWLDPVLDGVPHRKPNDLVGGVNPSQQYRTENNFFFPRSPTRFSRANHRVRSRNKSFDDLQLYWQINLRIDVYVYIYIYLYIYIYYIYVYVYIYRYLCSFHLKHRDPAPTSPFLALCH